MSISNKIKELEIDGRTFRLAPLKMAQIEAFIDAEIPTESLAEARSRTWKTIAASLHNADPGNPVTVDELREQLDLYGFLELHRAALEVSGLAAAFGLAETA